VSASEAEGAVDSNKAPVTLESPAYPPFVRTLAVILVIDLIGFGLWSLPALQSADWSAVSLVVFALAFVCIVWIGYWILYSRTRLEGDVLTQTWLWTKREHAADVAQLKLVHWRWLERVIAPRLLVRRRNGSVTWFHSADARLLTAFAERVAARVMNKKAPP
jgi:hypothetical protein